LQSSKQRGCAQASRGCARSAISGRRYGRQIWCLLPDVLRRPSTPRRHADPPRWRAGRSATSMGRGKARRGASATATTVMAGILRKQESFARETVSSGPD